MNSGVFRGCNVRACWVRTAVAVLLACAGTVLTSERGYVRASQSWVTSAADPVPWEPGDAGGEGVRWEPRLNTGEARHRVAVEVPPGRGGLTPTVALEYRSGAPNGPFGVGWTLDLPFIQRDVNKGLPLYGPWPEPARGEDSGDEVPTRFEAERVRFSNGVELVPVKDDYWRARNEGEFTRFQRVGDGWLGRRRDGVLLEFGPDEQSRVQAGDRVFRWYLARMVDGNGNTVRFEYMSIDSSRERYLRRVRYNQGRNLAMAVEFVYESRPDIITDFRPRFELKTTVRCSEIRVVVGGETVRSYKLNYSRTSKWRSLSRLSAVQQFGRDGVTAFPARRFGYTGSDHVEPVVRALQGSPAVDLGDPNIEVGDLNGDGLPDIVDTGTQPHIRYQNNGGGTGGDTEWGAASPMENRIGLHLAADDTYLADANGDGRVDFVQLEKHALNYYSAEGNAWRAQKPIRSTRFVLADPNTRLLDVNHDKRVDVLQTVERDIVAWINRGGGGGYRRYIWASPDPRLHLDREETALGDMNGDGIPDLLDLRVASLAYYPGVGYGEFGERVTLSNGPAGQRDARRFVVADLNGDGRDDLIYVGTSLDVWLNQGLTSQDHNTARLAAVSSVRSPLFHSSAPYRVLDVTGDGITDVVFTPERRGGAGLAVVDFGSSGKPNLLSRIDNGLGRSIRMSYSSSIAAMVHDASVGRAWSDTVPFPLAVVSEVEVRHGTDVARTQFLYRNPFYDVSDKEFGGFGEVEKREMGDATAEALSTTYTFDVGRHTEVLRGKLLEVTWRNAGGEILRRERNVWKTTVVARALEGSTGDVVFGYLAVAYRDFHERREEARTVRTDYERDAFGNVVRVYEHGRLDEGWGDERITTSKYTSSYPDGVNDWILDRLVERNITDGEGRRVTAERVYYDGQQELGRVGAGNPTSIVRWVEGSRWQRSDGWKYDRFGNVTAIYDGNYTAGSAKHFRAVSYDEEFKTYPTEEVVFTGNKRVPRLVSRVSYDAAMSVPTAYTDAIGNVTRYAYDPLGRLTAVWKPNEAGGAPSETYEYTVGVATEWGILNSVEHRWRDESVGDTVGRRIYYDGWGRRVMTRTEQGGDRGVLVSGAVRFDARGGVRRKFLPYAEQGTLDYRPAPTEGPAVDYKYDALGRRTVIEQPDGSYSTLVHEPFATTARDEEQTDPGSPHAGAYRRFVTDGLTNGGGAGRLREVHEVVKLTDRGTKAKEPRVWVTRYHYDALGSLVRITDAQGNSKRAVFDGRGRKILDDDPNRGQTVYVYDRNSNLVETRDAKGGRTTYTYDGANRLVGEQHHGGVGRASVLRDSRTSYVYDAADVAVRLPDGRTANPRNTAGRLVSVYDNSGHSHFSYDSRGRIEWAEKGILAGVGKDPVAYSWQNMYDGLDRLTAIVFPDRERMTFSYNAQGLATTVRVGDVALVRAIEYTALGQLSRMALGNGLVEDYEYDRRLRLSGYRVARPGTTPLASFGYDVDGVSNVRRIVDRRDADEGALVEGDHQWFHHDDLYRLTGVTYAGERPGTREQLSYRYDRVGNLIQRRWPETGSHAVGKPVGPAVLEYGGISPDADGHRKAPMAGPHAVTRVGDDEVEYDANGNVVRLDDMVLQWDPVDRLKSVAADDRVAEYQYDYSGRRVAKTVKYKGEESRTELVVHYVNPYFEVRGNVPVKYVRVAGRRVVRHEGARSATNANDGASGVLPRVRYFHSDHLGSVQLVTNAEGEVIEEQRYYPYGEIRRRVGVATGTNLSGRY